MLSAAWCVISCSDYEMVLELNPGNMEALREVKNIKEVKPVPYLVWPLKLSFPEFPLVPCLFQILGCPANVSEAAPPQEAPAQHPDQQSRVEAQQRQQEAVFHKDRVGLDTDPYTRMEFVFFVAWSCIYYNSYSLFLWWFSQACF